MDVESRARRARDSVSTSLERERFGALAAIGLTTLLAASAAAYRPATAVLSAMGSARAEADRAGHGHPPPAGAAVQSSARVVMISAGAWGLTAVLIAILALHLARQEAVRRRKSEERAAGFMRQAAEAGRLASAVTSLEERLDHLQRYDALTGLPNRQHLEELLERAVHQAKEEGRTLSVLIADVDRFKHVNDLLGPEAGDALLKQIARRLLSAVSEHDIVARVGSDEFAVVHCDGSGPVGASATAEIIRDAISREVQVASGDLALTAAIGIAVYPHCGEDAGKLLRNADLALGRAKSQGRNAIQVFDEAITEGVSESLFLEKRLFRALERREFLLHFQPYCDLVTGRAAGAEALLRWRNGDLGVVPPARFIPSLEETGMIVDVGRWVLENACGRIKEWGFPVSVNLSLAQFRHTHLAGLVAEAIGDFAVDPKTLTLEVTESVFLHDMEFATRTLKRLKDVGVSLSVDDFGTGYSSLSYLRKLPLDSIKIDMSFVRDVARDQDAASVVTAITTLARSLGLKTIAEGVETEEQRNVLHLLRCDMGQGFHFGPAIPEEEIGPLLAGEATPPFMKVGDPAA